MNEYLFFSRRIIFADEFPYINQIILTACDKLPDITIKLSTPDNINVAFTLPTDIHIVDGTLADIFSVNMKKCNSVMSDMIIQKALDVANGIKELYSTLYGIKKDDIKIISISTPVVEEKEDIQNVPVSMVGDNGRERSDVLRESRGEGKR